jgi:hypothetical protein
MNIEDEGELERQEMSYQFCLKVSILHALIQSADFYFAYHYYGMSVMITSDINISLWFLVNGIIGIQYSLFLVLYQIVRNTYRNHFIFTFSLILILALVWSLVGYIGFFTGVMPLYFMMFKLSPQSIIYVFTIGAYLN